MASQNKRVFSGEERELVAGRTLQLGGRVPVDTGLARAFDDLNHALTLP